MNVVSLVAQGGFQAEGLGLEVAEAFGQDGGPVGCLAVERLVIIQLLSHV